MRSVLDPGEFSPTKTLPPVLVASLSLGAAYSASAVNIVFTGPDGGLFNTATNYTPQKTPDAADMVITNGSTPASTINFAANGTAKNLSVNAGSQSDLTFDLNGNTLTLGNQSIFRRTSPQQTNGFTVTDGSTFSIGAGATLQGRGGINLVDVNNNSTLLIDGGALQQNDGAKGDLFAASGSTVEFTENGGTIGRGGTGDLRILQLQDGSILRFTLDNGMFSTTAAAPISTGGTPNLGTLDIDLAADYMFVSGEEFFLIDYGFSPSADTCTNAPTTGSTVSADGVTFEIDHSATGGAISLTAISGPVIPEPASLALLAAGSLFMLGRSRRHA